MRKWSELTFGEGSGWNCNCAFALFKKACKHAYQLAPAELSLSTVHHAVAMTRGPQNDAPIITTTAMHMTEEGWLIWLVVCADAHKRLTWRNGIRGAAGRGIAEGPAPGCCLAAAPCMSWNSACQGRLGRARLLAARPRMNSSTSPAPPPISPGIGTCSPACPRLQMRRLPARSRRVLWLHSCSSVQVPQVTLTVALCGLCQKIL